MPKKTLLLVSSSVCWNNETASNLFPFIAIFNSGNIYIYIKKSLPELNQGSWKVGIIRGSLILLKKLGDNTREMHLCIVVRKIPGPTQA
jgi:hypothetical protein